MNIILHGAAGRMGAMITSLAADEGVNIVAGADFVTDIDRPYPMYSSIADVKEEADAVIDFSTAAAVDSLIEG